jgi:hypothetical protein
MNSQEGNDPNNNDKYKDFSFFGLITSVTPVYLSHYHNKNVLEAQPQIIKQLSQANG